MKRNKPQKRIDLILNGKGGVGKSFFTVNFVQYLNDSRKPHLAIDTDNENSTLKRFHSAAKFADLSQPTAIDGLFDELDNHPLVVVDCRAASTDIFLDFFAQMDMNEALRQNNAALTLVLPVNHEPDSVKQVQVVSDRLNDSVNYIIVKNHSFGDRFDIYDASKTRERLIGELGAKEIDMPKLPDWLVVGLNKTNSTITPSLQKSLFSIFDRQRLKNWQRNFYDQIKSVESLLLDAEKPQPEKEKSNERRIIQPAVAEGG